MWPLALFFARVLSTLTDAVATSLATHEKTFLFERFSEHWVFWENLYYQSEIVTLQQTEAVG